MSSDSKAKAKGFLKKLTSKKTIFLESFATDVLHTTSLALQSPTYSPGNIASDCDKATSTNREVNGNVTVDNFKIS